jgi:hypothetical protein
MRHLVDIFRLRANVSPSTLCVHFAFAVVMSISEATFVHTPRLTSAVYLQLFYWHIGLVYRTACSLAVGFTALHLPFVLQYTPNVDTLMLVEELVVAVAKVCELLHVHLRSLLQSIVILQPLVGCKISLSDQWTGNARREEDRPLVQESMMLMMHEVLEQHFQIFLLLL